MPGVICLCGKRISKRGSLLLHGKPVCDLCAHRASHLYALEEGQIPCPVTDGKGNVIPFGTYPNIDWS